MLFIIHYNSSKNTVHQIYCLFHKLCSPLYYRLTLSHIAWLYNSSQLWLLAYSIFDIWEKSVFSSTICTRQLYPPSNYTVFLICTNSYTRKMSPYFCVWFSCISHHCHQVCWISAQEYAQHFICDSYCGNQIPIVLFQLASTITLTRDKPILNWPILNVSKVHDMY